MESTAESGADRPGVLVLPPVLWFGTLLVGIAIEFVRPLVMPVPTAARWLGGIAAVAAIAFGGAGRAAFARAGTNANPLEPALHLVESGPFRVSRNPMYVGMAIADLGIALATRIGWLLVLFPIAVAVMHWGVILREERYLSRKFGAPYDEYRRRVRRYL